MSWSLLLGFFARTAAQKAADGRAHPRGEVGRVEVSREDRGERVGDRLAVEHLLAREHLGEDDAERPDVRALVGGLPARLLGLM
jgi:hypothetical protein